MSAITTQIGPDFVLTIPDSFRRLFPAGQEVALSADPQGRLIVTPVEQIRALLMETFGMWADRTDLPADGVAFVDEIRRGRRLSEFERWADEAD